MTHRHALALAAAGLGLALIGAGCGALQDAAQTGSDVATQAAVLQQTAAVAAPTLQALGQTAQAAAPTLQAQAEDMRGTLEALAPTLEAAQPTLAAALPTFEALLPTLQASGIQGTAEAMLTALPALGGDELATAEAYATQGVGQAPPDIPLPPRSTPILTTAARVLLTTELSPGAVRELYEADMPAAGWTASPKVAQRGDAAVLQFEKPGRHATITIAPAGSGAGVEIVVEAR